MIRYPMMVLAAAAVWTQPVIGQECANSNPETIVYDIADGAIRPLAGAEKAKTAAWPARKSVVICVRAAAAPTNVKLSYKAGSSGTAQNVNSSIAACGEQQCAMFKIPPVGAEVPDITVSLAIEGKPDVTDVITFSKTSNPATELSFATRDSLLTVYMDAKKLRSYYDQNADTVILVYDGAKRPLRESMHEDSALVNFDQNDRFRIVVLFLDTDQEYAIGDITGDFKPTALAAVPSDNAAALGLVTPQSAGPGKEQAPLPRVVEVSRVIGPFTSEHMSFRISSADTSIKALQTTTRINPTYHLGYSIGIVWSSLKNPDFEVADKSISDTTNTIHVTNNHRSVIPVFMVSLYSWRIWEGSSAVARGRDIQKDPSGVDRFYPSLGVAIENPLDNLYLAMNYEFKRAFSITGGFHAGKVRRLENAGTFRLGVDTYARDQSSLDINEVWDSGWFLGLRLDTSIVTTLLTRD